MALLKEYGDCTGPFGFPMKEEDARELDDLLEKHTKDGSLSYKRQAKGDAFECFIDKEHADVSVITDYSIDKAKEVVNPNGLDLAIFRKSPVVTLSHNYRIPSVGKSIWQKKIGNAWKAKTLYHSRPESHPKELEWVPDTTYHMVKVGGLPGKSIGFLPVKWHEPTKEERESDIVLAKANIVFDEVKVFEYAVCTIGCNSNALVEEVNKGFIIGELVLEGISDELKKLFVKKADLPPPEPQVIKITSYRTVEQYKQIYNNKLHMAIKELTDSVPLLVKEAIDTMRGKV